MKDLYLLITIVQRSDAEEYEEFYRSQSVGVTYSIPCNGTAHARTLSLLGLEKTEKTMLFSAVSAKTLAMLKRSLTVEMKIDLPNRGVAMAVPLSGIGGMRTLEYFKAGQKISTEEAGRLIRYRFFSKLKKNKKEAQQAAAKVAKIRA